MSDDLAYLESSQRKVSFRGNFSADEKTAIPEYEILLRNVTVYDLAKAFKRVLDGLKEVPVHQIQKINVSIDEQIEYILNLIDNTDEVHFMALVENMKEKIRIIVTFIALLELVKAGRIKLKGSAEFNDFLLTKGDV
jgi:segregation and condensation protein A